MLKKISIKIKSVVLIALVLSLGLFLFASGVSADTEKRVIVKFSEEGLPGVANPIARQKTIEVLQDRIEAENPSVSIYHRYRNFPAVAISVSDLDIDKLRMNKDVEAIELDDLHEANLASTIPVIDADLAHLAGYTGSGQAVAILDTGVDAAHGFLNVAKEACFSNAGGLGGGVSTCPSGASVQVGPGSAAPCVGSSSCFHGTHVAGIAAGNGVGYGPGVAKDSEIIAVQVFTLFGSSLSAYSSDIIAGLDYVRQLELDLAYTTPIASVNLSLGGGLYSDQAACDLARSATKSAIDDLRSVGIASVIASGNNGSSSSITAPGCISTAVAVGATTDSDSVASFSNSNFMVDILAPGVSVTSSIPGGGFGSASGTSMATPHVAGAYALLRQVLPLATVDDILSALQGTGLEVVDTRNGLVRSRIDLDDAAGSLMLPVPGIVLSETGGSTEVDEEGATSDIVDVSLNTQPIEDVTLSLLVDEDFVSSPVSLVFNSLNWDVPQSITIQAIDDDIDEVDLEVKLATLSAASNDVDYDGKTVNFDVYVVDNDESPNQPPEDISLSKTVIDEGRRSGSRVASILVVDVDSPVPNVSLTCDVPGVDDVYFVVDDGKDSLKTAVSFDFENPVDDDMDNLYEICIRATDNIGNVYDENFLIEVSPSKKGGGKGKGKGSNK